jgi:hypothetical protein
MPSLLDEGLGCLLTRGSANEIACHAASTQDREHRVCPFFAAGAGAKYHVVAGPAPFPEPIPNIASLVTVDEWKP